MEFDEHSVAEVLGTGKTSFQVMKDGMYSPFADKGEWELAEWLINNTNQRAMDEFLKLPITREWTQPSYQSKYTFMKLIDQLPTGPEWKCKLVQVRATNDDSIEELELWLRDLVACVRELIGNPAFHGEIAYTPEKVYTDCHGTTRRYDEMWTGDWWWETQRHLPAGATVAPVILASDKTELLQFKGDKNAWPVYLSIGNISKGVCRQPACHASILLDYIPVSKMDAFKDNSVASYHLFHYCMKKIVEPLVAAGREGVEMVCADGRIHRVFPVLAAYIRDHPEQCLVACCTENRCPKCLVPANQRGTNLRFPARNQTQTTNILHMQATGQYPPEFIAQGLRTVFSPFWADLPHTNIFSCISSDILHQLHQGVFKDHLKKWCATLVSKKNFDVCFCAMPLHPGLRHFKEGISKVKQRTGADHKQLQHVFVSSLVGTTPHQVIVKAGRALLDFIYIAQYQSHTDDTILALQQALNNFHDLKEIFVELECQDHFNIPKFHSLLHYTNTIKKLGSLDGLNTENLE
ncbi:hypothetical protein OG21DRAFT_1479689 [Imleria badia]|nr:hypothetical protein OG21DRAFT_1479689 [Imleria badia]